MFASNETLKPTERVGYSTASFARSGVRNQAFIFVSGLEKAARHGAANQTECSWVLGHKVPLVGLLVSGARRSSTSMAYKAARIPARLAAIPVALKYALRAASTCSDVTFFIP